MPNNRRQFIRTAGLLAGAAALSGLPFAASASTSESSAVFGPVESAAERKVSAVISRYGRCVGITRHAGKVTEFQVKVHSAERFARVFNPTRLPFDRIYVGPENTLKFKHGGADFTIVNLA